MKAGNAMLLAAAACCGHMSHVVAFLHCPAASGGLEGVKLSSHSRGGSPRVRLSMSLSPGQRGDGRGGSSSKSRRDFFSENAVRAASLVTLLALPSPVRAEEAKTIVITGATSGLGKDAAAKLVAAGHNVYLAARTEAKAKEAALETGAQGAFECDLSSLDSVRSFVKAWGGKPIDALCMNAGMAPATKGDAGRTKEGFEVSVGTNHLGHFLLSDGLYGSLAASSLEHPRLVVTASSVHDPDTPGGDVGSKATLGELKGFEDYAQKGTFDMVDGGTYDGDKAYKDSKLCNVLFTLEAARRLKAKKSKVQVNCFSPGLIPSSGLFRSQNKFFVSVFSFAASNILKVAATMGEGGDTLKYMVEDKASGAVSGLFYATEPGKPKSGFAPRTPSKEAQDTDQAQRLWALSEKLVGIKSHSI